MFTKDLSPNRDALKDLRKRNLALEGTIQNVTMPEPDRRNVCLINVRIAPASSELPFHERDGLIYDHLWLQDTRPRGAGYSCLIGDKVQAHVKVKSYLRPDKVKARTVQLVPGIVTESAFYKRLTMVLQDIKNGFHLLSDRVEQINQIIDEHIYLMQNNQVLCFDRTKEEWLALLRKEKGIWMRQGGVYTTMNRQGRRSRHRPAARKRINYRALGFV